MVAVTFFACIAAASDLSAPRTQIQFIEDLRFDTRSPVGWLLVLCLFAFALTPILLAMRFLDIRFITTRRKIFFIVVILAR